MPEKKNQYSASRDITCGPGVPVPGGKYCVCFLLVINHERALAPLEAMCGKLNVSTPEKRPHILINT